MFIEDRMPSENYGSVHVERLWREVAAPRLCLPTAKMTWIARPQLTDRLLPEGSCAGHPVGDPPCSRSFDQGVQRDQRR